MAVAGWEGGGEFLNDIALKPTGTVHSCCGKSGDKDTDEGDACGTRKAEGGKEVSAAGDKGTDGGSEGTGLSPVGVLMRPCGGSQKDGAVGEEDAHAQPGCAGENDECGKEAFCEHGAVADELGIAFTGELFAAGSAANKTMESADSTACDGDEKKGKDGGCAVGVPLNGGGDKFQSRAFLPGEKRSADGGRNHKAEGEESDGGKELEGVDEIARLKKEPDGKDGGDVAIAEQKGGPCPDRHGGKSVVECVEWSDVTQKHGKIHQEQADE